jgi:hypothetical protein
VRLSDHALGLEAQPLDELDRSLVILRELRRQSHEPSPPHEVRHRAPEQILAPPEAPIEHDKMDRRVEPRPHVGCRSEPDRFVPLHELVELVRRREQARLECIERAGDDIVEDLWVLGVVVPHVFHLPTS